MSRFILFSIMILTMIVTSFSNPNLSTSSNQFEIVHEKKLNAYTTLKYTKGWQSVFPGDTNFQVGEMIMNTYQKSDLRNNYEVVIFDGKSYMTDDSIQILEYNMYVKSSYIIRNQAFMQYENQRLELLHDNGLMFFGFMQQVFPQQINTSVTKLFFREYPKAINRYNLGDGTLEERIHIYDKAAPTFRFKFGFLDPEEFMITSYEYIKDEMYRKSRHKLKKGFQKELMAK